MQQQWCSKTFCKIIGAAAFIALLKAIKATGFSLQVLALANAQLSSARCGLFISIPTAIAQINCMLSIIVMLLRP